MNPSDSGLPLRILTFYGDDFTGASATMEVLSTAGLETVLFLEPPSVADLERFPAARAVGIAGLSRSQSPQRMDANLPTAFRAMHSFGAPVNHYKTCSTFDSSPELGSIGHAADLAIPILGGAWHPLVIGAPAIGRYQAFGNLFATINGETFRLDRHPVMSTHPATPMVEADVRVHLQAQTSRDIGLLTMMDLKSGMGDQRLMELQSDGAEIIAIDVLDQATLVEAGRLAWNDGNGPVFALGSQGIEYALIAYWRSAGLLPDPEPPRRAAAALPLLVVSGSCSSVTADQIETAEAAGFVVLDVDVSQTATPSAWSREIERLTQSCLVLLGEGRDVIVSTSRHQPSRSTSENDQYQPAPGSSTVMASLGGHKSRFALDAQQNDRLGRGLGEVVAATRTSLGLSRAVIAGGDTSGHAVTALGATALSVTSPLSPGVPLCRLHATDPAIDGLEVALKGGQMGEPDFFVRAKGSFA